MNEPVGNAVEDLRKQVTDLSRAVKIGFFVLLLGASYFNIRATIYIPRFQMVFYDMLGDSKLPLNTEFAFSMRNLLMAFACALPAVGLTALFAKSVRNSVLTVSACMLAAVVQYVFIWWALVSPLEIIIRKMSSVGE